MPPWEIQSRQMGTNEQQIMFLESCLLIFNDLISALRQSGHTEVTAVARRLGSATKSKQIVVLSDSEPFYLLYYCDLIEQGIQGLDYQKD